MTDAEKRLLMDLELLYNKWSQEWVDRVLNSIRPTLEDERIRLQEFKKLIAVILGLLWGLCSIPCETTLWDCEAFDNEIVFHSTCTSDCYVKFVETVNNLFPTLCEFKIIEES